MKKHVYYKAHHQYIYISNRKTSVYFRKYHKAVHMLIKFNQHMHSFYSSLY
jgi:hypothetical protein